MMHLRTASVTLFAILSAIISSACDRNTTTALEPVEPSAAPTIGPLAARAIALAMAQTPIRAQVLIDLRGSPYRSPRGPSRRVAAARRSCAGNPGGQIGRAHV